MLASILNRTVDGGTHLSGFRTALTRANQQVRTADLASRLQIQEVNSGFGQITDSFQAETEGIAQINSAISQISTVTQAQASTSEETASAAEELRAQTGSVRQLTTDLHELVEGASARDAS